MGLRGKIGGAASGQGPVLDKAPVSEGISLFDEEDANAYAQTVQERHRLDPRVKKIVFMGVAILGVMLFGALMPDEVLLNLIRGHYPLARFLKDVGERAGALMSALTLQESMLPYARCLVVVIAGMGLALSGAVYQGAFRNALVAPSTLGVMTGANTGKVIFIAFAVDYGWSMNGLWTRDYLSMTGLSLYAFAFSFFVVALVLLCSRLSRRVKNSPIMLIITGQVIAGIFAAFNSLVTYYFVLTDGDNKGLTLRSAQISSFYTEFTWADIAIIGLAFSVTFVVIMALRNKMMLLSFEKAEARSMGLEVGRVQVAVVGLCTLLTAVVVSFCGAIGFVGFMVPHLARRLVGPDMSYLLPASAVLGGLFVLGAYTLINFTMGIYYTTLTGIFISMGGAAVFLVTALKRKGGTYADWR